ncbi:Thioesterase superfamily protein [Pseudoruegeria aquimaris]|uniref:Thioesterase superfamily protein n=1 Tax=Pseudoruegeria aquimaris TaxID=393663 RepID=A0A1Y5RJM3_9RHOB|nr:PaaI family thioesterase [Pseudoruegeria aquimaris]SLN18847.1 Thioesterase superfamily protein [Pseudoruegeria aquimaris]
MPIVMDAEALNGFLHGVFEQVADDFIVESVTEEALTVRLRVSDKHLRPGGTISGPSMFGLADVAVYLAVLSKIGPQALAVTTNAGLDFLRKPAAGVDLIATCRLLKLGKVLAVGDVLIHSEGQPEPVARANMTYSIPPRKG